MDNITVTTPTVSYQHDSGKRVWYRFYSDCCYTSFTQKMLYQDKIVKDPNFKLVEAVKHTIKTPLHRKWWKFWQPRISFKIQKTTTQRAKYVTYRYCCDSCGKKCRGELQTTTDSPKVSKSGAAPDTPAKKLERRSNG